MSWTRAGLFVSLLAAVLVAGCTEATRETVREPTGAPLPQIKILTYNTLHGLEPSGLTVKAGESQEARQARLDLQFQQLSRIQPDVMLLQEVNPLPEMAEQYVAAMKRAGLQYRAVHQVDACGVRLAPGLAIVPGLNNGLAVLAKSPLPESQQQKILEGYQKGIAQARRVDFLFLMRKPADGPAGCFQQQLFGESEAVAAAPGSDHYGVLVTYITDASQCG
jgi:hypothetical protein